MKIFRYLTKDFKEFMGYVKVNAGLHINNIYEISSSISKGISFILAIIIISIITISFYMFVFLLLIFNSLYNSFKLLREKFKSKRV